MNKAVECHTNITDALEKITCNYTERMQTFETKYNSLSSDVASMHSTVIKHINELLDTTEAESENREKYLNILNVKIEELSKKQSSFSQNIIENILQSKTEIDTVISNAKKISEDYYIQNDTKEKELINATTALHNNYAKMLQKLTSLQADLSNLSNITSTFIKQQGFLPKQSVNESGFTSTSKQGENTQSDRLEVLEDTTTGATVKNHYKNNMLVLSEKFETGKKVFEIDYSDGKVLKTRKYDNNGKVILELDFYQNGQLKTRKEFLIIKGKNQTIETRFDISGNKMKF